MALAFLLCCGGMVMTAAGGEEPLPSWHDGPARTAILAFLERTTTPGSPDFLEPAARIAVFDMARDWKVVFKPQQALPQP